MNTKPEQNKYRNWVFTWNADESHCDSDTCIHLPELSLIKPFLEKEMDIFVFQYEEGEIGGRKHLQGAFRTPIRTRQSTVLTKFLQYFGQYGFTTKQLTVNRMCGNWDENFVYCTKDETRLTGTQYHCSESLRSYEGSDIKILEKEDNLFPLAKPPQKNTL